MRRCRCSCLSPVVITMWGLDDRAPIEAGGSGRLQGFQLMHAVSAVRHLLFLQAIFTVGKNLNAHIFLTVTRPGLAAT